MIPHALARHIPRQPQVLAFAVVLVVASAVSWWLRRDRLSLLAGFDAAALVYLVWMVLALSSASLRQLRARAARYDAGRITLLVLAALVFVVVLVAVASEVGKSQRTRGELVLIIGTLLVAWCFGNMIFALHYMHLHYMHLRSSAASGAGKLFDFPGDGDALFWDFIYFAYTIGMTFQTSDVGVCATAVRRIATLHALLSFVFNVGVVALSVNLLASS